MAISFHVCNAQKPGVDNLIGEWGICNSKAAPILFIFSNRSDGEKGLLKNWNDPADLVYKTSFTYTISDAPKDSLTGNAAIDENLFVMTTRSKSLSGGIDVQTFLVYIATKDSIGFIQTRGSITRLCKVKQ
jgi:hypothetical protein